MFLQGLEDLTIVALWGHLDGPHKKNVLFFIFKTKISNKKK